LVAVGANGEILLSDDQGKTFRQARVPVRLQLNGVYFANAQTGWAVGHAGVILRTDDAGETWIVQRKDFSVDQPLFSVYFADTSTGWAVGLWSLMLRTGDGGRTWEKVQVPVAPASQKADLNLFRIFGDGAGGVFVAGERGFVLCSTDGGASWQYSASG